jgi:hypothetical protein
MLAKSTRGYALSTVMARGFTFEMLQELVQAGLASRHGQVESSPSADHRRGPEGDRRLNIIRSRI